MELASMKPTSTFDYHFQNPNESPEGYEKRKRLELGRELQSAKKIYLDTKFWLFLRDIRLERSVSLVSDWQPELPLDTDAAMPSDVRKVSDLPERAKRLGLCPSPPSNLINIYP